MKGDAISLMISALLTLSLYSTVSRSQTAIENPFQSNLCRLRPLYGLCDKSNIRFYYNNERNVCLQFYYSGCGGNGDIFYTQAECENSCVKKKLPAPNDIDILPQKDEKCFYCSSYAVCAKGECRCRDGFEGDGFVCKDINECLSTRTNKCHKNAYCLNTIGSYRCECQVGYAGNGIICTNHRDVCKQPFDGTYGRLCSGSWEIRHFYNATLNSCQRFWYGGCMPLKSQNFFNDVQTCEEMCVRREIIATHNILQQTHPVALKKSLEIDEVCMDAFDATWKLNCGGKKELRYYYNRTTQQCTSFSFDTTCGYIGLSRNIFTFYKTCKQLCRLTSKRKLNVDSTNSETEALTKIDAHHLRPQKIQKKYELQQKFTEKERCLIPFDEINRHDCWGTNTWEKRYYFNPTSNECNMFWYGGCVSRSNRNFFMTAESCESLCLNETGKDANGTLKRQFQHKESLEYIDNKKTIDSRCLEPFDLSLKENCNGFKDARSYYNATSKQCEFFSFDLSCRHTKSTGNFFNFYECEILCSPLPPVTLTAVTTTDIPSMPTILEITSAGASDLSSSTEPPQEVLSVAEECLEPFDQSLKQMCGKGDWKARYYYDQKERSCRIFWWDQCRTYSRNFFRELLTCQRKCEGMIARPCLEPFDEFYNRSCGASAFEMRWYFNHEKQKCDFVYYGGCKSQSRNLFPTRSLCKELCETPATTAIEVRQSASIYSAPLQAIDGLFPLKSQKLRTVSKTVWVSTTQITPRLVSSQKMIQYNNEPSAKSKKVNGKVTCEKHKIRGTESVQSLKHMKYVGKPSSFVISDACLEPFEKWLTCSCRQGQWERRYYYSASHGKCRMYWYDGCKGSTKNNFNDLTTCRARCEGVLPSFKIRSIQRPKDSAKQAETSQQHQRQIKHVKVRELADELQKQNAGLLIRSKNKSHVPTGYNEEVSDTTPISKTYGTKIVKSTIASDEVSENNVQTKLVEPFPAMDTMQEMTFRNDTIFYNDTGDNPSATDYDNEYEPVVAITEECLQPFDRSLERTCRGGKWQPRYFYDKIRKKCQMYWYDGCQSLSRNNFDDLASCKWKCEGKHSNPRSRSCLDIFDAAYLKKCWSGPYEKRYYFNHEKKLCELFYYGGCLSESKNIFRTYEECEDLCETPGVELFRACYEPFDHEYEKLCSGDGSYRIQYYYDQAIKQCRLFWFGNCKRDSENIFPTLATCQWICERRKNDEIPKKCIDKFDRHYADSCSRNIWMEKWYFDHTTGLCTPFWHDGCTSDSQNIFADLDTCLWLCEKPDLKVISEESQNDEYRCMEEKNAGHCNEKYPAFFYNKHTRRCEPFAYSGCGGNNNRFLTLQQCESSCGHFKHLSEPEIGCHLPLAIGHGKSEKGCQQHSGFRYYYNKHYERCGKFWYYGCGGNGNRFSSHMLCERICRRTAKLLTAEKLKEPSACFLPTDIGRCHRNVVTTTVRWSYDSVALECRPFNYTGCGGNKNRFASARSCNKLCKGLLKPEADRCAYYPDWGPCNQLRYMWFYNMTSGSCEQFLYGGCDGNPNKFSTFEECQTTCEVPVLERNICLEPMDRGKGCPGIAKLEIRWYYDVSSNSCIGYHSEGCGKSANDFKTERQCKETCKSPTGLKGHYVPHRFGISSEASSKKGNLSEVKYVNEKPVVESPMKMHQVLSGDSKPYFKTEGQWVRYDQCVGYRYNISGTFTRLSVYLCVMEEGGSCHMQVKTSTDETEKCEVLKPWLKGLHFYSWFFVVDRSRPLKSSDQQRHMQPANETIASVIVLPLNDCHNVC